MKKIVLAVVLALGLSGCASVQTALQGLSYATVGVNNPVTKTHLYAVENSAIVIFAGLNAYRQACIAGAAEANCRGNIRKIQVYTRQIPPLLTNLRAFVKNNDQVNALTMYNALTQLFKDVKATAAAVGVAVGG